MTLPGLSFAVLFLYFFSCDLGRGFPPNNSQNLHRRSTPLFFSKFVNFVQFPCMYMYSNYPNHPLILRFHPSYYLRPIDISATHSLVVIYTHVSFQCLVFYLSCYPEVERKGLTMTLVFFCYTIRCIGLQNDRVLLQNAGRSIPLYPIILRIKYLHCNHL